MIVTYRRKQTPKRASARPATITAGIVTARKPKRYQRALIESVGEPDASVQEFYVRMGLGAVYDRINWTPEQNRTSWRACPGPCHDSHIVTPSIILQSRTTLRVVCLTYRHDASVDIVALIDKGHGDRPLTEFCFRCRKCGGTLANPRLDRYGG